MLFSNYGDKINLLKRFTASNLLESRLASLHGNEIILTDVLNILFHNQNKFCRGNKIICEKLWIQILIMFTLAMLALFFCVCNTVDKYLISIFALLFCVSYAIQPKYEDCAHCHTMSFLKWLVLTKMRFFCGF